MSLLVNRDHPHRYNVLGHFKLCSVLAGGVVFFGDTLLGLQAWGIALTLVGVIAYTHIKLDVRRGPCHCVYFYFAHRWIVLPGRKQGKGFASCRNLSGACIGPLKHFRCLTVTKRTVLLHGRRRPWSPCPVRAHRRYVCNF